MAFSWGIRLFWRITSTQTAVFAAFAWFAFRKQMGSCLS
jgi:hypothetical protein